MRTLTLAPFMALLLILPFPGTVTLRLICLAVAFLMAIVLWRRFAPPTLPCRLPLAFWASIALLSLVGAADPEYSLGEIKNEIVYALMAFIAFFAVTREESDLRRLLGSLLAGAFVLCVWALEARLRLGAWLERGTGYGGTGAFPGYVAVIVPMLLLFGAYTPGKWRRLAAAALFLIVCVTGLLSLQRILVGILAGQAAIALILLRRTGLIQLSRASLVASLACIVVAGAAASAVLQQERVKLGNAAAVFSDIRLAQWPAILERIGQNPLIGGGFGRETMKKSHPDLLPEGNESLWHAHNVFLNYGLEMGVPGMVALAWLFFSLLREYWRSYNSSDDRLKWLGVAGIMLVTGVVLRNLVSDMFVRDAAILFWSANGALLGFGCRRSAQEGDSRNA
jgi:putative inorganic carbon (HCO3(-)) transporter